MINIIPKFSKIEDKNDVYALQIVLKKDNNGNVKKMVVW